jgi:hypothetical protein
VENRILKLKYHLIESLVVDRLTKVIPNPKFNQFVRDLGLEELKESKNILKV